MGTKRAQSHRRHENAQRICVAGPLLSLTLITINRSRDRAAFCTLGLAVPHYRVISPLSLIMAVQISKNESEGRQTAYGIVVRLSNGGRVRFACRSRDSAAQALAALHSHLQVETRSSGRRPSPSKAPDIRDIGLLPRHTLQ